MKKLLAVLFIFNCAIFLAGCSAVMALRQPDKVDLRVLTEGASRENVMTYLGGPMSSEKTSTGRVDLYKFTQGFSGGHKAGRAVFHLTADIFTLFIWEIIGMPTEAVWNGKKETVKIEFDEHDRLKNYIFLRET